MKNKLITIITGLLLALPIGAGAATYGPVSANETLWSIAARTRPSYDVSVQQMMLTIRMKNPQAFSTQNINSLKKGAVLKLPTLAELQQLDRIQALHTTRVHNQNWKSSPAGKKVATAARKAKTSTSQANLAKARQTQTQLRNEITTLKAQLKQEQQRSEQLATEVKRLQSSSPSTTTAATTTSAESSKLQAELTELKSMLADKDNHIKNLQASLKEASEAIKRQHSENLALYEQLKTTTGPANTTSTQQPPVTTANGKGELKLAGVGAEQAALTKDGKPIAFTDQLSGQQAAPEQPATTATTTNHDTGKSNGVPLKNLLEQRADADAKSQTGMAPPNSVQKPDETETFKAPSRISLIIALISLLFILALLWRAFSHQRVTKRSAAEARNREAEAFLRSQNDGSNNKHPSRPDGRQEPEITL